MRRAFVLSLALVWSGVVLAQAPEGSKPATPKPGEMVNNPPYAHWAQFKAGSSVTVKDTISLGDGSAVEATITSKLVSKTKDVVKVETVTTRGYSGKGPVSRETETTVTEFPSKVVFEATQSGASAGYSVTEGKETLDLNGKKVEADWVEATVKNGDESSVERIWTAREVPGGVVKRAMTSKKGGEAVTTETTLVTFKGALEKSK